MNRRHIAAWEAAGLSVLLLALGYFIVPAHTTSLWMDRDFTGWSAPIAVRIAHGTRLYADGGHTVLPPLSFLVPYWLFGTEAVWWVESLLNFGCQAALILTMFVGLSRYLPRPVPFVSALAIVPIYLALPKSLLSNSLAQLLVATAAVLLASVFEKQRTRWSTYLPIAAISALCMLTKLGTGAGVVAGLSLAIVAFGPGPPSERARGWGVYFAATLAFAVVLVLICLPWLDPMGLLRDVFWHGNEPKGGTARLLGSLLRTFPSQIAVAIAAPVLLLAAGAGLGTHGYSAAPEAREDRAALIAALAVFAAMAGFALSLKEFELFPAASYESLFPLFSPILGFALITVANGGLALVLLALLQAPRDTTLTTRPLAAMSAVTFFAAIGTAFSGDTLGWTYGNYPLVLMTFALVLAALRQFGARKGHFGIVVFASAVAVVQIAAWSSAAPQIAAVRDSTVPWESIKHLKGAYLRPSAIPLVGLVDRVRVATARDDQLLLLPNDPNVEAWFDRPRPNLSSAIVFGDQYLDQFVDEDFQRLKDNPPKVILIGPRSYWRWFQSVGNGPGYGAVRLIDRVSAELLPERYEHSSEEIMYQGKKDTMDLYIRRD